MPYFRKANDREKGFPTFQMFQDNHNEFRYARKTNKKNRCLGG